MSDALEFKKQKLLLLEKNCREQGLPLTVQRRVIMEELAGRLDHPTADQVFDAVAQRLPGMSRTTVYRVLDAFVALGIAQKINHPEAKAHFDADTGRHHHVRCVVCGAVADVHDEKLNHLQVQEGAAPGFRIADYSISFVGTCAACQGGRAQL